MPELFSKSKLMGTFKGFSEKGFEFAAEIVTPYNSEMQDRPQLGQFLLIQLGTPEEASLGRITKFVPSGMLATAEGEDYINTMQEREQEVPEDLKKQKLKYKVQIKLLGAVKNVKVKETIGGKTKEVEKIIFVPSQRRLPHLGAKVALPSDNVLTELCQLSGGDTDLGDYVLGEFIFSGKTSEPESVMRHISPKLKVSFNINNLVSKRSVVFARAGYGKSNLIKYLVSDLYRNGIPQTQNHNNAGVLIFDADGEYFWPNLSNNRPGLCDVPQLRERMIVFTNRNAINPYYQSWKAGEVRLDIRELPARDVIGIAISPERQSNQNVIKLKSLTDASWRQLVDLVYLRRLQAPEADIARIIGDPNLSPGEIAAAKSNMFNVVNHLHDPHSTLIIGTLEALRDGLVVVVDISMLSSTAGYNIAGLLMRRIFSYNQENFTGITAPIPVISIIEEAQSVLGRNLEESSPFVEWVKEGRKYDLGAIMVTQQPGSMAPELLSQADNWFCFHLLSEVDAGTLGKYNAHFSHDILAHLIGEPISGNCYMWSAPKQPFVLPVRIRNFEELYGDQIKRYEQEPEFANSPAIEIRERVTQEFNSLANTLKTTLQGKTLNTHTFQEKVDGIDIVLKGLFSNQLFRIIEEMIESLDTVTFYNANQLKHILFARVFEIDIDDIKLLKNENHDYMCCKIEQWTKIEL